MSHASSASRSTIAAERPASVISAGIAPGQGQGEGKG